MSSEKKKKRKRSVGDDGEGAGDQLFFKGITAHFVETGMQPRRLQVFLLLSFVGDSTAMASVMILDRKTYLCCHFETLYPKP